MKTDIVIGIATHKKYTLPKEEIYLPIHSGASISKLDIGYVKDNTGENISNKNPNYSELTALYWLWKNSDADIKGLVHYRRHFSNRKNENIFEIGSFEDVLDEKTIRKIMESNSIIVPKKRHYFIETVESHYVNTHYLEDLIILKEVMSDIAPDYLNSLESILKKRSAHMFNMFIMKSQYFDSYCEWLFEILFEVEKRHDISEYNSFHARVFGRLSEILLDVWLEKNKVDYYEIPMIFMEKQNWREKVLKFLKSKYLKVKY